MNSYKDCNAHLFPFSVAIGPVKNAKGSLTLNNDTLKVIDRFATKEEATKFANDMKLGSIGFGKISGPGIDWV